jgi:hypothetical protein
VRLSEPPAAAAADPRAVRDVTDEVKRQILPLHTAG